MADSWNATLFIGIARKPPQNYSEMLDDIPSRCAHCRPFVCKANMKLLNKKTEAMFHDDYVAIEVDLYLSKSVFQI